jgi:uncharacterized membrane protein YgcG
MMSRCLTISIWFVIMTCQISIAQPSAQEKEPFVIPESHALINDFAGSLSIEQRHKLVKKIRSLVEHNGAQVILVILPSTGSESVREYTWRIVKKWSPTLHPNDILFVINAENASFFIVTGPAIAGVYPDIKVGRLIRHKIVPYLKEGRWNEGVDLAVDELISAAKEMPADTVPIKVKMYHFNYRSAGIVILAGLGFYYVLFLMFNWASIRQRCGQ